MSSNYGKILIKGQIEVLTGLHIGGTESYSAIGSVDGPVIRDRISGLPVIPGSSLKGKLRTLLQRTYGESKSHNEDNEKVLRLFGSSASDKEVKPYVSRLTFRDAFMDEAKVDELKSMDIRLTEVKTENTINRSNSRAMPRAIERVIRGNVFNFEIVYDCYDKNELAEDFENINTAMGLLEKDYLGGHGSRGSGKIKFKNIETVDLFNDLGTIPKIEIRE